MDEKLFELQKLALEIFKLHTEVIKILCFPNTIYVPENSGVSFSDTGKK